MLLNDRNVEEAVFTRIMALMVGWNRADRARAMRALTQGMWPKSVDFKLGEVGRPCVLAPGEMGQTIATEGVTLLSRT